MFGNNRPFRGICLDTLTLIIAAGLMLAALGLPIAALAEEKGCGEAELRQACELGEIVRLHILADGDDDESQRVKLAVRDAVLDKYGDELAKAGERSADAAYEIINENLDGIRLAALECARGEGFCGEVKAEAGLLALPEKRYGNVLLPEGVYRGLRITLGSGCGKNWWCVLFPRICLELAEDGVTGENSPSVIWGAMRILRHWTALEI